MTVLPPTRPLGLPEANFILTCLREMNRLISGKWAVKERSPGTADYKAPAGRIPPGLFFEDELGRRSVAKLLSKDEARRIAANPLCLAPPD